MNITTRRGIKVDTHGTEAAPAAEPKRRRAPVEPELPAIALKGTAAALAVNGNAKAEAPQLRLAGAKVQELDIELAQMEVKAGQPEHNFETMLRMIEDAKSRGVEVLVFPEMCVGGYMLGDQWLDDSVCRDLASYNERLRIASKGITLVWGNVCLDDEKAQKKRGVRGVHPGEDGGPRRYNAAFVAQNGKWCARKNEPPGLPKGMQPKVLLPNYSVFDDKRYFTSLRQVAEDDGLPLEDYLQPFIIKKNGFEVPLGAIVCEDGWIGPYRSKGQAINPMKAVVQNGATAVVNLSASPWNAGKEKARDAAVAALKKDLGDAFVPLHYVSCVGTQNNGKNVIAFDGGSAVYNARGQLVAQARGMYQEQAVRAGNVAGAAVVERVEQPLAAQHIDTIVEGIRTFKDGRASKTHPKFIIGLSGGVDSAVDLVLLVRAVGAENVIAVNMPSKYNSNETQSIAATLAKRLGVKYMVAPIEDLAEANRKALAKLAPESMSQELADLTDQNLQAKQRGTAILSNLAQMYGGVFVNNGNKNEVWTGYATLYGDWGGAISLIGGATKRQVFDMCRYINDELYKEEIIPRSLLPDHLFRFEVAPSAELKTNHESPIKFGYHCAIIELMSKHNGPTTEDLLRWYLEGKLHTKLGISVELMERYGITNGEAFVKDLEWLMRMRSGAVFKRVQSVPIIRLSPRDFGYDERESILPYRVTAGAKKLIERIVSRKLTYKARAA